MAEFIVSAVLPVLFEKLTSPELLNFATQEGVRSKLKKWEYTLKMIKALLNDAEQKQQENEAVKMWLDDLQDLAYDAEDILDEYATEALRRKLKIEEHQARTSRARKLIPACCNIGRTPSDLWSDFGMRSKIDDVTSRLEELHQGTYVLRLKEISGPGSTASSQRLPTSTLPTELAIYGRDDVKHKILKMVLRHEPGGANFDVIPIVGMGGIGKTTLAREVYNDKVVEDFNPKAWVCASDDYDVFNVTKEILESITSSSCDKKELDTVQNLLKDALNGKKFLIVLDDVWSRSREAWESLKAPFMAGAPGSKIIVTTRDTKVASTMRPRESYDLKLLSDEDCWSIFVNHALNSRGTSANWNLDMIREKVVQKCKGLPLAARTLGGLLYYKESEDEWMDILDSKIWDVKGNVLPVLRLSYYHLPSHLKRCFAYCAILPKDFEFEEKELVFLWMAEGLIQQSSGNKQLEDLGGEYFHDLLSRSLFQISKGNSSKFIMHDLVNDLALVVSGKLSFRLEDELDSNNQLTISEKTRYASYICHECNANRRFEVFNDAKTLRTHLPMPPINDRFENYFISNRVVSNLLSRFKKLRVLSLQKYYIVELPDLIGGLRLLRYLNLSNSEIRSLPESLNSMCNLQTLILRNCNKLLKWPSSMGNLIKLRHFDIVGASSIEEMPVGIRKWECLRTLSNFIVGKDSKSSLNDLKHLKFLWGELHISRLENVIDLEDTIEVLSDKKDLRVLLLEWGSRLDNSWDEEVDKKVLDMLRPHQNLEKLTIKCYGGTKFSSWVGSNSFSQCKMTVLELVDCRKCTSLPSLGLLRSLKSLTVKGMNGVKSIGSEFYGEHCSNPFRSLETLYFENLEEWECWDPIKENESFHKLQELSIVNCPRLSERLPSNLCSLKKLVIRRCEQLVVSLPNIPTLCELELDECKKILCSNSADFESLESMTLSNISDFGDWSWQEFKKVQSLVIEGCEELIELCQNEIFLEKPLQGLHSLMSLRELEFRNCNALTTLLEGVKQKNSLVEELRIDSCPSLMFIFRGQLLSSLKQLCITNCEKLQCLLDDKEATFSSSSTCHLEELYIDKCPSLRWLTSRDQLSTTLTRLHISHCSKLTTLSPRGQLPTTLKDLKIHTCSDLTAILSRGQLPEMLETLDIADCPMLKSIVERFHNNMSLRNVYIQDCPNLVFFPKPRLSKSNLVVWIDPDQNLKAQAKQMPITSLQLLELCRCPEMSIPTEGLPTNLTSLEIEGPNLYDSLAKWGLHKLTSLRQLSINGCPDALSFPEDEMRMKLPHTLTHLRLENFSNQKYMSSMGFPSLTSLEELRISYCPNLTSLPRLSSSISRLVLCQCPKMSFPTEGLPTNITSLEIEDSNLYEPLAKWDLHKLTNLSQLSIHGCPDASSFPEDEMRMKLPRTLTHLRLENFTELKDMSSLGFRNLTFLEELKISDCPNLTSLSRLSSSILRLDILNCPLLKEACKRDEGREWPNIAPIPCVVIDSKFIYDPEEEATAD